MKKRNYTRPNTNLSINFQRKSRGVSIYIAFMIMAVLMVIAFGMSTILLGEMKVIKGMGDSVIAFFAADTGIERTLWENATTGDNYSGQVGEGSYNTTVLFPGTNSCPSSANYCIKSIGIYKNTRRAIQILR
jgi:hypothetical protein